jgi:hypothetical protein
MRMQIAKSPVNGDPAREMLWRVIRILRKFTIADLLSIVKGVNYKTAQRFLMQLRKGGYVLKQTGRIAGYQCYALLNDTGPMPSVPK